MSSYPSPSSGLGLTTLDLAASAEALRSRGTLATAAGLVAAAVALTSTANSQTSLTWVKDINTTPLTVSTASNPNPSRASRNQNSQKWVKMGSYLYFVASDPTHGSELFRSNGRTANLVKDIDPGTSSSYPYNLTLVGNKIFFHASTPATGRELWVTDGTAAGTRLVKDIRTGSDSGVEYYYGNIARVGNKIVFGANSGRTNTELWVSDGTAAGTVLLKDIYPGAYSSSPGYMTSNRAGNKVFFRASDGIKGTELWVTDGSTAGTRLVKDIRPGPSHSLPATFLPLGSQKVVFSANNGTTGIELWISDGTASGTTLVKDVYAGPRHGSFTGSGVSLGNKVLFLGVTAATGAEPWITDGTPAGTMILKDIWPKSGSSSISFSDTDGGKAYWGCESAKGWYEIWMTDGTPKGTRRFSRAKMSTGWPYNIAATGGKVFFCGYNVTANTGWELCMTDGTTTATVKDIRTGSASGLAYHKNFVSEIGPGKLAFRANDGSGDELWFSQGTAATTTMVDINKPAIPSPTESDNVSSIEHLFGKVIFSATDGRDASKRQHGQELWISDGTSANTRLLKDIAPGSSLGKAKSSFPGSLCRLGNYIFFSANDGRSGAELWRTDGTTSGTRLFKDIRSGPGGSLPGGLTRIGDRIFFAANNGIHGVELWVTDGTVAGTRMVKDIHAGAPSSSPALFARLGRSDKVLFGAFSPKVGLELWISDGTRAGTRLLKDIHEGSRFFSSFPAFLTSYKGKVYFQAWTRTYGSELWVSDGTSAGTRLVKDGLPGMYGGYAEYITVQNGRLFYRAYTHAAGSEMHSSDGTAANTGLYWDYAAGRKSTSPLYLTAVGSRRIYFAGPEASRNQIRVEPRFFDVTNKTSMEWNANLLSSSNPRNRAHGRAEFAVSRGAVYAVARPRIYSDDRLMKISNGATAQRLGRAQGRSVLAATDPRLGQNMKVSGTTAVSRPWNVLCLGLPVARPAGLGWFAARSYAYFDLKRYFYVAGSFAGANYSAALSVPNVAGLVGRRAVMQSFVIDRLAFPAKSEATNGVQLTFGR